VGVHRVHLARVECGMRNPSDRLLARLEQALGASLDGAA
jgi:transcriptional regulator with XRE-family HTH domain